VSNDTIIDCDTCIMRETPAGDDCVVTYLCDRKPHEAVVVHIEDLRAMRSLADAGLVPELRHQSKANPS
jgi:hypothetical protein